MWRRRLALGLLGTAILAGVGLAFGPARVTWLNTGLRIDYPWPRGAAALLATAASALLAALFRHRLLRLGAAGLALVGLLLGLHLLAYRLEAGETGITLGGLLGSTTIAWGDVTRVETGAQALVITDRTEAQVRVGANDLGPDERARLERMIARRVKESSTRPGPPR
ncbi:MAG TPA: PH domain-containing protein [Vicinamibacteria bacterium]|nr:PH domain-containing protein [Vicinamibacteria bacterium]